MREKRVEGHGSPETVVRRLKDLHKATGLTSLPLHYPPYYGHEKAMKSLRPRHDATHRGDIP